MRGSVEPSNPGTPAVSAHRARAQWLAVLGVQLAIVLWLFGGAFTSGRVLFFRDLSTYYAPEHAVVAQSLRHGTWPLWDPLTNAGQPLLASYPVDLLLLLSFGPRGPLGIGAALHLSLALAGALLLARRLGMGPWGALVTSAVYGIGGFVLSTVNLQPLFEAAAWAPFVLWAFVRVGERADGRRLALLAAFVALQTSTLAVEMVAQTLLLGLVLTGRQLWTRRGLVALAAAGALASLLAAPAILGVLSLLHGTARARGFGLAGALSYSIHPVALLEAALPRLLGDPHAFSDRDYWGRVYFPEGYPYLIALYVGPIVLLLAARGGRRCLLLAAAAGLVLALGRFGPLALLPAGTALPFRGPQKLLFLTHTAVALLAGFGLERFASAAGRGRGRWLLLGPGLVLLALSVALRVDAATLRALGAAVVPALADRRGLVAATTVWPAAWLPSAALATLAGLVLARGGRWALVASPLVVLDLLLANGALNPLAPASFYELRADTRALVAEGLRRDGPGAASRWFSYGVASAPVPRFDPVMARAPSDVWLYYLDRQSLLPRMPALDGLPGAFDLDRTGWSPEGSTLDVDDSSVDGFPGHYRRLQLAGVRWVLSFRPLPPALALERARTRLPEITAPLGLFELPGALPRAFFVRACEIEADPERRSQRLEASSFDPGRRVLLEAAPPPAPPGPLAEVRAQDVRVDYEPQDTHTVRVTARTPPGFVVVLDGYAPGWTAADESRRPVPLLRADGRYRAIPTAGGPHVFTMRYRPPWRAWALALLAVGVVGAAGLASGAVSEFTGAWVHRVLDSRVEPG